MPGYIEFPKMLDCRPVYRWVPEYEARMRLMAELSRRHLARLVELEARHA